jgi:hypothetical protein
VCGAKNGFSRGYFYARPFCGLTHLGFGIIPPRSLKRQEAINLNCTTLHAPERRQTQMAPDATDKKIDSLLQCCKEQLHNIKHINQIVSRLDPSNEPAQDATGDANSNGDEASFVALRIGNSKTQKNNSDKFKNGFWENFSIGDRIQAFISLLLVGTLIFTIISNNTNNKALKTAQEGLRISQDQFIKDQRPYIWITRPSFDPVQLNAKLTGKVTFRNFGKSPALNIHNDISNIYFGPDAAKSVDNILDGWKTFKIVHNGHPSITLPPENPNDPESYLPVVVAAWVSGKGFVPITDKDSQWVKEHDGGAIMAGNIQYTDMAGNSYYTEYCVVRLIDGTNTPCFTHNEIH